MWKYKMRKKQEKENIKVQLPPERNNRNGQSCMNESPALVSGQQATS